MKRCRGKLNALLSERSQSEKVTTYDSNYLT